MVYILAIGDMHIPTRAQQVPEKLREILAKNKDIIRTVVVTGNFCNREGYDIIRTFSNDVQAVKGDLDGGLGTTFASSYPDTKVITVEGYKIGICHGHQVVPWGDHDALEALQRRLDCDVLITGHTHIPEVFGTNSGKVFVNPGSATGAFSPISPISTPSFALLDVKEGEGVTCFVYKLIDDAVAVEKYSFPKRG